MALPLLMLGLHTIRNRDAELSPYIGAVSLILGIILMDMLLNATLTPFTWLTAGAVLGNVERLNPRRARVPRHALRNVPVMSKQDRGPSSSVL